MKTTKPIVTIFWHLYGKRILNCKIYDLNQPGPHGQGQILKKIFFSASTRGEKINALL